MANEGGGAKARNTGRENASLPRIDLTYLKRRSLAIMNDDHSSRLCRSTPKKPPTRICILARAIMAPETTQIYFLRSDYGRADCNCFPPNEQPMPER
jgi:hypothetical protein